MCVVDVLGLQASSDIVKHEFYSGGQLHLVLHLYGSLLSKGLCIVCDYDYDGIDGLQSLMVQQQLLTILIKAHCTYVVIWMFM